MKKLLFLLILFHTTFCFGEQMDSKKTLKIAAVNWPPFLITDTNQPGLLIEYVNKIYENTDYKLDIKFYPWSRVVHMAKTGDVHAILAPTKNEAPFCIYPKNEIALQRYCLYGLKNSKESRSYKDLKSILGKKVIYPQDSLPATLNGIKNDVKFISKPYFHIETFMKSSMLMMQKNRADYSIFTFFAVAQTMQKTKEFDALVYLDCVEKIKIYLAFSPLKEHRVFANKLIKIFDKRVVELKKKKYFESLIRKYDLVVPPE